MPTERIAMHKIKELLRLKYDCALSHEQIARALSISKGVVTKYVKATAILDRLLHHSHVLNIKGRSYRLRDLEQAVSLRT